MITYIFYGDLLGIMHHFNHYNYPRHRMSSLSAAIIPVHYILASGLLLGDIYISVFTQDNLGVNMDSKWLFLIKTFEFSGYTGVPRKLWSLYVPYKLQIRRFLQVQICTMNKHRNCLYVYFSNVILLMFLFTYYNFFYINRKNKRL